MILTQPCVGRLFALALLFPWAHPASASGVRAAPRMPFTVIGGVPKTLTPAMLAAVGKTETPGQTSPGKKTLTFRRKTVRLVIRSGPASDMLSYRIDGLRNPTLVVPAGATLRALFVNTDDDMTHNLRFAAQSPPFKGTVRSVGTPDLPHKSKAVYRADDLTLRVPVRAGTYAYFCTVPGHAPGGMYGTLIVR